MLDVLVSSTLQQTQSGWCNVELADVVLFNHIPVSREVRIGWSAFEYNGCDAQKERRVHDIGVSSNPANVTTAEENIAGMDVAGVVVEDFRISRC